MEGGGEVSGLREQLRAGRRGLEGLFIGTEGPAVVEMAGQAGFDYVVLDGEHGDVLGEMSGFIRSARAVAIPCIVRVPLSRVDAMSWVLDMGADGVLVPGVRAADDLRRVVQATRYPPEGGRGLAFTVPAAHYTFEGPPYLERARRETVVWAQVETHEAVRGVDALAAVEGIDALFIGPTDLSMALGLDGQPGPVVEQAIQEVVRSAESLGRPWGIFTADAPERQRRLAEGAWLVATAAPVMLRRGIEVWRHA